MKKPRLTTADRLEIETSLKAGKSVCAIAKALARPVTTITREIKSRAVESVKGAAFRIKNRCVMRETCERRGVCAQCLHVRPGRGQMLCRLCSQCNSHCGAFVEQECGRLAKPPFVCNGCPEESRCVLRKKYYLHVKAQESYETVLSESRSGANVTEEELLAFDKLLEDLTGRGQSVYAATANNPDRFTVSVKTIYRYSNGGLLSTKRHQLPRACSLRPRKTKSVEHKVDKECRIGRTWKDYLAFIERNPGLRVVQMDTVEGVKGGKVLLTLMFNPFGFMHAVLLDSKTSACVIGAFRAIRSELREKYGEDGWREVFALLFPVILTDNGTEFTNPKAIETDGEGNRLTSLFYCDPGASYQKAQAERNHGEIRRVLPKGTRYTEATSFDGLTQDDVSLVMSHVNSYVRQGLKGIPYDLFTREYGEEAASLLGISRIDPNKVTLKPSLLDIEVKVREWVLER